MSLLQISVTVHSATPYGVKRITAANRDPKILVIPRASLETLATLAEKNDPVVYLLVGEPNEQGYQTIYVGHTDHLQDRLNSHSSRKTFWSYMIAIGSHQHQKQEFQLLEALLYERMERQRIVKLDNKTKPSVGHATSDRLEVLKEFLDMAGDTLLAVGFSFFDVSKEAEEKAKHGMLLYCKGRNASATGIVSESGMLVKEGSTARKQYVASTPAHTKDKLKRLVQAGVLKPLNKTNYKFTKDYLFPSPSNAANVILGGSADGLLVWKNKEGRSLKALEESQ